MGISDKERWAKWPLQEELLMREPAVWLPDSTPTELELFVRWICKIHHHMPMSTVYHAIGRVHSPFKNRKGGGKAIRKTCFDLADWLNHRMGLQTDVHTLANALVALGDPNVDWHDVARMVRAAWIAAHREEAHGAE